MASSASGAGGAAGSGVGGKRVREVDPADAERQQRKLMQLAVEVGQGYAKNDEASQCAEDLLRAEKGKTGALLRWVHALNQHTTARLDPSTQVTVREMELAAASQNLVTYWRKHEESQQDDDEHRASVQQDQNLRCAACAKSTKELCMLRPCDHLLACKECAEQLKLGTHFGWANNCPACKVGVTGWVLPIPLTARQTQNCWEEAVENRLGAAVARR